MLFRKVGYYRPTRRSCSERALSKCVVLFCPLSLPRHSLHPLLGYLLFLPILFFFIIDQRSKWFFGALRFHDDGTEQCTGLIPTACSFVRNRGKGKIAASPPGDPLRFVERVGGLDDNWRICEIVHDYEAAFLFDEMPPLRISPTNKIK